MSLAGCSNRGSPAYEGRGRLRKSEHAFQDSRIIFVATHALLCGCGRLSGPDAGDADAGDRTGQSVRGPEIVRFDGFEGDSVASFWRPGNAGDGRYAPGSSRFRPTTPEPAPSPSGLPSGRVTSSKSATTASRQSGPSWTPAGTRSSGATCGTGSPF